jgi:glyceraldehyde-3-phosphate dehydrogenase (NAD(P))
MPYDLYLVEGAEKSKIDALGIPVKGSFQDLIGQADIILDSSPGGAGLKNKALYEKGLGADYLKLTSCNTTGLIRSVDCLDRKYGVDRVAITIIRRAADPGDYHRGLTNALQIDKAPSHQAVDLMTIMPHIEATGILVHTPVTHGHIITVLAHGRKGRITRDMALEAFRPHPRIRVVTLEEGFLGNASFFRYARDLGNPRGDMYEIGLWEDSIVESGDHVMYAINIPQESVTIPETMDAVRAALKMQPDSASATAETNRYLGMGKRK